MATAPPTRSNFAPALATEDEIDQRYKHVLEGGGTIYFGVPDSSNSSIGFAVPVIIFNFKSAFGNDMGGPTIAMRAPASLSLAQLSNYSSSGNIFGEDTLFPSVDTTTDSSTFNFLSSTMSTMTQAIVKRLLEGGSARAGYLASAGQSGIDQFEFSNRSLVNPFQQLVYKGPSFKMYNFPFVMRPKNLIEAQNAMKIISAFKIASSPKVQAGAYVDAGAEEAGVPQLQANALSALAGEIGAEISLTFGYPDLTEFQIMMYSSNSGAQTITPMYESLACVISSVSTDYGQQKMSFFIPQENKTVYYPTEITLTLSLQEIAPRTAKDAIYESNKEGATIR